MKEKERACKAEGSWASLSGHVENPSYSEVKKERRGGIVEQEERCGKLEGGDGLIEEGG